MSTRITKAQVYERLRTVTDPELNIDIVSLGLIYDVKPGKTGLVRVEMTLTTPGCPLAPVIDRMVKEALEPLGVKGVEIDLIWDPPWTKDMMSEEGRLRLGMV